jgi:sulfopyruvate decarboxylase TPP-binding subunit
MDKIVIGVPCSDLDMVSAIPCTREDEAIAFACGVALGGGTPVVFMQNSGLGTCLDALTSLYYPYGFDFELIVSHRDHPEHHALMGRISKKLMLMVHYEANRCS